MWISISNQAYVFLNCILGGAIIAFIYDVFRVRRRTIKSGNLIVYLEDFVYWIIVALVLFAVVYRSNEGEIRGYLILGMIIGIILYILLLSRVVMRFFLFLVRILYRLLTAILIIILFPFKVIIKTLKIPAGFLCKMLSKCISGLKRRGKRRIEQMGFLKRKFKNIRRKI